MKNILPVVVSLGLLIPTSRGEGPEKPAKLRFTIGKETTRVTEPLDEKGRIDYATALNRRLGEGVKPENNANVLLWKAFGPHPDKETMPAEFFKWMGIAAPAERGDYFIDVTTFGREHLKIEPGERLHELREQVDRARTRPWKAKDDPDVSAWLKANEKPLALVVEASKRSQYFSPLTPPRMKQGPGSLLEARLPGVQKCRDFAAALAARALLHAGEGRVDDAWQDLLACHRLARLLGHGGTLIEALVAIAIDGLASGADITLLGRGKLSTKQLQSCLRDLQALPPLPELAGKIDLGERFVLLDVFMRIDDEGVTYMERMGRGSGREPEQKDMRPVENVDWDPALRNANRWYDRMAGTMRIKERPIREKQVAYILGQLRTLKEQTTGTGTLAKLLLSKDSARVRGESIGNVLISMMIPAFHKVQHAADRFDQVQANVQVAFALAIYHRDHGRYPTKLEALAPKILKSVPRDIFSDKPLKYRLTEDGYLFYSVGLDGRDNGGRGDDLAVRMPMPEELPR
jgi:hypothetical protein